VAVAKLRSGEGDRLWLLRAQPGAVLPRHTHSGSELTVVLQGAYVIDDRIFGVGDLEDADEGTSHQPIVTTRGECLCLAATTGPLKFDGWAARLAQRYLGI
jgi:putative transcriptional regulator